MLFKFDANQEYQVKAIEAAAGLFEGQPRSEANLTFTLGGAAVPNRLDLDDTALLKNLQTVQAANGIPPDESLQFIESEAEISGEARQVKFANFSVEMETGTGKTYVYIRTALELFRRFGLRKFIIVVPSIAIKEGVLKTLEVTQAHLRELYGNTPYRYYVYKSDSLTVVRQFALSDSVELMIMTIDSFNKASNVIRQSTDRLQGETPIHLVQAARPILILDEPQNMESRISLDALALLNPLFALRYSATHRNPYNLIHRLTPFDAYRQGLVKRIEVDSVVQEDDANRVFVRLEGIKAKKRTLTTRVTVHKLMKDGTVKEHTATVGPGDSLQEITGRPEYAGFEVDEINKAEEYVRFANNVEIRTGEAQGADKEAIFEAQIRQTVETHFRRQEKLKPRGVKVLSLFFIDRVDNYAREDGLIRVLFSRAFNELKARHDDWRELDPERVQAAYFAQRRHKGGVVEFMDTRGESAADEGAYELIMKAKERLLSFEEPVSFIFSHSALREGWDNPNVFQICTLNQTSSEIKKRQEVGRGIRLCVNQEGERLRDEKVNVLTVVANESYERYVETLQSEIAAEYGLEGAPPKPVNARRRGTARLRKEYTLKPEFKELWERIKHKTRYAVKLDTEKLLNEVVKAVDAVEVRPPRVTITKVQVQLGRDDMFEALQMSGSKTAVSLAGRYPLPNLVEIMANLMQHTTPPVKLTRATLLEVFKRVGRRQAAVNNPHEFATTAVRILKEKLADELVYGIQYEKINEWYEMTQLQAEIDGWMDYLAPAERSVYDHVEFDSEVEKDFIEGLEKRDDVKIYLKLPSWFTVDTPVGAYNPDWAIVMEDRDAQGEPTGKDLLYLVRETKGTTRLDDLRPDERRKIHCGEKHFKGALGVDYRVVTSAGELP